MKKMKSSTLRAIVMLAVVVVIAVGYFSAVGIGNLSGFGFDVFALLCPLGYLESIVASKVFVPRALLSFVAVVALVVVFGRVFCAWICPMPFLQRVFPGIGKKKDAERDAAAAKVDGEDAEAADGVACQVQDQAQAQAEDLSATQEPGVPKPNRFGLDSRFAVLLGALGSAAIFGFPVFCLVCPVGLSFATVYFVMRLFAFGETTWTVIAVPAFLILEVVFLRKWCSKICPLGAVMSLISQANKTFRPTIDDSKCLSSSKGISCMMCARSCPEKLNIRKPEESQRALSNCTKCRECSDHCPVHAITFPLLPAKKEATQKRADGKE